MVAAVNKPESVVHTVRLSNISWETYTRLLNESEGRQLRMTYDAGWLEIEEPSFKHERIKGLIGLLVVESMLRAAVDFICGGSTTWKSEEVRRGTESDQCYYITNFERMKGVGDVDLSIHPPPDLVIEVDLSNSSLISSQFTPRSAFRNCGKFAATSPWNSSFAAIAASYPAKTSRALPAINSQLLTRFLTVGSTDGSSKAILACRQAISK